MQATGKRYWIETLGCPKNQVDSDKLVGTLLADGMNEAESAEGADLVVVNTCAFIEAARQESVDTILALSDRRKAGARLVVTGCMAERYGDELAEALPEVEQVSGFGVPVTLGRRDDRSVPLLDLLNLPRPPSRAPWASARSRSMPPRRRESSRTRSSSTARFWPSPLPLGSRSTPT